jgi:hypothetical protein
MAHIETLNQTGDESRHTLAPRALDPLPLGAIKPAGWLANQLRIQANGLSGHLDEFWPDIKDSKWIGGTAEGWERVPYWLDGVVPLAYLLDDETLQAKVGRYVDYILEHQHETAGSGPNTISTSARASTTWTRGRSSCCSRRWPNSRGHW